eukprot:766347-Hanusia_phi.AAC.3
MHVASAGSHTLGTFILGSGSFELCLELLQPVRCCVSRHHSSSNDKPVKNVIHACDKTLPSRPNVLVPVELVHRQHQLFPNREQAPIQQQKAPSSRPLPGTAQACAAYGRPQAHPRGRRRSSRSHPPAAQGPSPSFLFYQQDEERPASARSPAPQATWRQRRKRTTLRHLH